MGGDFPRSQPRGGGHLEYYVAHGISPVRYRISSHAEHFQRRASLYALLGLPPIAFKGAAVVEIAPGSGQNSLYPAICLPASLDLVEPNPAARLDIEAAYGGLDVPHTKPAVHPVTLQDFAPGRQFDIVICENWLGSLPSETELIARLADLTAPDGNMVLTIVPEAGFFANIMRHCMAVRLDDPAKTFEARTCRLVEIFGPHLATLPAMTRSHEDWVRDCLLNPHYLHVALPLDVALKAAGPDMQALGTQPVFRTDWRWFKQLSGAARALSQGLMDSYQRNLHNLVDHRQTYAPREARDNHAMAAAFAELYRAALVWRAAFSAGASGRERSARTALGACLSTIEREMTAIDPALAAAVSEIGALWSPDRLDRRAIAAAPRFGPLFGRETVYLSLWKPRY